MLLTFFLFIFSLSSGIRHNTYLELVVACMLMSDFRPRLELRCYLHKVSASCFCLDSGVVRTVTYHRGNDDPRRPQEL